MLGGRETKKHKNKNVKTLDRSVKKKSRDSTIIAMTLYHLKSYSQIITQMCNIGVYCFKW